MVERDRSVPEQGTLEAALKYADRGRPVFPIWWVKDEGSCGCGDKACRNTGKHPIGKPGFAPNGFHDATTDPAVIRRWWKKYPLANIGVATGVASGLVVLDSDPGKGGDDSVARLAEEFGDDWPALPTAYSGGGGEHYYFDHPGDVLIPSRNGVLAAGIDIKADGGYIIVPPSGHASGGRYKWVKDSKIHVLPGSLLPRLVESSGAKSGEKVERLDLRELFGSTIPEGQRRERVLSYAGSLRARFETMTVEDAKFHITGLWTRAEDGEQPFPLKEALSIVEDVWKRYPAGKTASAEEPWPGALSATGGKGTSGNDPTQAQVLLEIIEQRWELVWWDEGDGEPFAIEKGGPNIALPMRGHKSFRAALAYAFRLREGKPPSNEALSQVLLDVEGQVSQTDPTPLALRVARLEPGLVYIDIGDKSGRCVEITAAGWTILPRSPVTFRRTRVTRALPEPDRSGDLNTLKKYLRIDEKDWPLVVAWLIHNLFPDIPHAILTLMGPENAGKTQVCKRLAAVVDPSAGTMAGPPSNPGDWVSHAVASWVVGSENVSHIEPWWSDALCRAAYGDAQRKRKLYTGADVDVQDFQRCILMNGISFGTLKPDFMRRRLPVELPERDDQDFEEEAKLDQEWERDHPGIVGGFYNVVVEVLKILPSVEVEKQRRLPDFARVLAAVDEVLGTNGFERFRGHELQQVAEVIDNDLLAQMLLRLMDKPEIKRAGELDTTLTTLLETLNGELRAATAAEATDPDGKTRSVLGAIPRNAKVWPQNVQGLSNRLRRLAHSLRKAEGIRVVEGKRGNHREAAVWSFVRERGT